MSSQDVRRRFQKIVPFQSNGQRTEDLGRGMVYRDLILRLRGAPTCLAANNTIANTERGDAWGVVKNIEILVNNNQVIRSLSGNQLWWLNYVMYGEAPEIQYNIGDGATANPVLDSVLVLPFWMFRSIRPMDTALDSRVLSDLKIRITWGTYTDISAGATAWTTEPYVEVHSLESAMTPGPFSLQTIYSIEKTISATDSKFQVFLPVNDVYRGFLLNTTDAGVDSASILNNVKIKSGLTVFYDAPIKVIQQYDMGIKAGIGYPGSLPATAASTYFTTAQRSADSLRGAWTYIDLVTDGFLTEAIDTLGFSEFFLELDVTVGVGATKLYVLPIQVTPVRGK